MTIYKYYLNYIIPWRYILKNTTCSICVLLLYQRKNILQAIHILLKPNKKYIHIDLEIYSPLLY